MSKDDYDSHDYDNPSDDDYDDPVWQHGATIHEPLSWLWSAESLEASANILEVQVRDYYKTHDDAHIGGEILGPYYMLVGFAIECLLKGIIVANGDRVIKGDKIKFVDGNGSQHNLVALADKAGFVCATQEEERMLRCLTENIEWSGRYPTPQRWEKATKKIKSTEPGGATMEDLTHGYCNHDMPIIRRLLSEVKSMLESKLSPYENKVIKFI